MNLFVIGAVILVAQHLADAAITSRLITSGRGEEANPLIAILIKWLGPYVGCFIEKLLLVPIIFGTWYVGYWGTWLVWVLVAASCVVIWNNWRVLHGQKGLLG